MTTTAPKRIRTVEGSCWQCKDQRVLCKLEKPTCGRCEKVGRVCEYGNVRLRWGNGLASRGRNTGRGAPLTVTATAVSLKNPKPAKPSQWQMLYFAHELLPKFSLQENGPNMDPFAYAKDPLLTQAVIAISNAHCLYKESDPGQEVSLSKVKNRLAMLTVFREHLTLAATQASIPAVFLANVMLCLLDGMIEPTEDGGSSTYTHFVGGRAILKQFDCLDELFSVKQGVPAVMLSIFAMGDLTQALLSGDDPYFRPSDWQRFKGSETWWTWLGVQDAFIDILAICSAMAHRGHLICHGQGPVPNQELYALQAKLERTRTAAIRICDEVEVKPIKSDLDACNPDVITWASFCSAYRAAASIYAYRALWGLGVDHSLVQSSVEEGIVSACDTKYPGKLAHCLLFPMLIIGAHCQSADHRKKISNTVADTGKFLSFGCVKIMYQFLHEVWSQPDEGIDWWTRFELLSKTAFIF